MDTPLKLQLADFEFWMVWRLGGGGPTMAHATYKEAHHEAMRLAKSNPGSTFYVLAPTAAVQATVHVASQLRPVKTEL